MTTAKKETQTAKCTDGVTVAAKNTEAVARNHAAKQKPSESAYVIGAKAISGTLRGILSPGDAVYPEDFPTGRAKFDQLVRHKRKFIVKRPKVEPDNAK